MIHSYTNNVKTCRFNSIIRRALIIRIRGCTMSSTSQGLTTWGHDQCEVSLGWPNSRCVFKILPYLSSSLHDPRGSTKDFNHHFSPLLSVFCFLRTMVIFRPMFQCLDTSMSTVYSNIIFLLISTIPTRTYSLWSWKEHVWSYKHVIKKSSNGE